VNYYLWNRTKFDLLQSEQISEKKKVNAPSSHIKEEFNANLISDPDKKRQLTDKVIAQIAADARRALFKNWQGLMVGDGIVWFTELGTSTSTPQPEYILLALGMFAFQTEWTVSDGP
jgi:hypothetical protein